MTDRLLLRIAMSPLTFYPTSQHSIDILKGIGYTASTIVSYQPIDDVVTGHKLRDLQQGFLTGRWTVRTKGLVYDVVI